jgi:hypothetical protein
VPTLQQYLPFDSYQTFVNYISQCLRSLALCLSLLATLFKFILPLICSHFFGLLKFSQFALFEGVIPNLFLSLKWSFSQHLLWLWLTRCKPFCQVSKGCPQDAFDLSPYYH